MGWVGGRRSQICFGGDRLIWFPFIQVDALQFGMKKRIKKPGFSKKPGFYKIVGWARRPAKPNTRDPVGFHLIPPNGGEITVLVYR